VGTPQLPREEAPDRANLVRLQPLRVVLSGRDRRYIRVTSFLLMRKGYEVAVAAPDDAALVAQRKRADVVLVEGGESRAASAGPIAALLALSLTPSVLIVTEDEQDGRWNGLTTIKKWIPLDALVGEIEGASRSRPVRFADAGRSQ
jgi:hypothetical protein